MEEQVEVIDSGIGGGRRPWKGERPLQAFQIREQLATQSLSLGNPWPQLLLSLFK
jgi:hypothetical protein